MTTGRHLQTDFYLNILLVGAAALLAINIDDKPNKLSFLGFFEPPTYY